MFRQQASIEAIKTVQNKYAEILAKITLDFGRTVAPVVDSYAKLLKSV